MKLYELSMEYQRALDLIEATEDDLTEEQWDILTALEGAFNTKIENVAKFIKSLQADVDAIKAERQRLASRERSLGRKVDWLKGYLKHAMESAGKDKVKGELLTVSLRKAPVSCVVEDAERVPAEFREEVTEIKVDRNGIIRHFKQTGEILAGVEMVTDRRTVWIR